jgi:hypothetical protein
MQRDILRVVWNSSAVCACVGQTASQLVHFEGNACGIVSIVSTRPRLSTEDERLDSQIGRLSRSFTRGVHCPNK